MNDTHVFSRFGGTRFLLTLGNSLINTLLLIGGYIDQHTYEFLIMGTVAVFIAGNTTQNAVGLMAKGKGDGSN